MDAQDRRLFESVRAFNPYDLYSKAHAPPDIAAQRPFYEDVVAEFLREKLRW
jgi:inositol oxygenase